MSPNEYEVEEYEYYEEYVSETEDMEGSFADPEITQ